MADGRVIIDTALDTSGLEQGAKALHTLVKGGVFAAALATIKKAVTDIAAETEKLNTSIRRASTLFGDANVNYDSLSQKLQTLAGSTGLAADELGNALYDALSAGIPATDDMSEAMDFLEKSAKTAIGGFADLSTTVTATASVLNAYGMSVEETDRVQGILMQTQNKGITTVAQLGTTLAQVVPTASAMGVSFEQVGAALATMTASGTQTAQATTSLNSALSELGKDGQTASDNLKEATEAAGMGRKSFQELMEEGYSLADVFKILQDYAEANGLSLLDMFGSVEAGRAALQLASGEGEKFNETLKAMYDTEGLVESASSTMISGFSRFRTGFSNLRTTIGNAFRPAVESAAGSLGDMMNKLSGNYDASKELEPAIEDLKTATEEYKRIQEETAGATDTLSEALREQALAAKALAALLLVQKWNEAELGQAELEENIRMATSAIEAHEKHLDDLAVMYGVAREDVVAYCRETGKGYSDLLIRQEEYIGNVNWLNELTTELNAKQSQQAEIVRILARNVRDGAIELQDVRDVSYEVASAVEEINAEYERGASSVDAFGERSMDFVARQIKATQASLDGIDSTADGYDYLTGKLESLISLYDEMAKAQGKALWGEEPKSTGSSGSSASSGTGGSSPKTDGTDKVQEALDRMSKSVEDAQVKSILLGDAFSLNTELLAIYENALDSLIENGLDETDARVVEIAEHIKDLNAEMEGGEGTTDEVAAIMSRLGSEVEQAGVKSRALGDAFNLNEELLGIYKRALEDLIAEGLDETDARVAACVERINELNAAMEDGGGAVDRITPIMQTLNEELEQAEVKSRALGDTFDLGGALLSAYSRALDELIAEGLDETDSRVQMCIENINALTDSMQVQEEETDEVAERLQEMNDQLATAERLASVYGDSYDLNAEKAAIYTSALEDLAAMADVTEEQLMKIKDALDSVTASTETGKASWDDLKGVVEDFFSSENLAQMFGDTLKSAVQAMADSFAETEERLQELKEEILDLQEDLAEAYEELADAQARGDEEAIANAEALIKGKKELISAAESEKTAVEDGSEAWASFGKAALNAIGQALLSLGAQLAAQAVLQAVSWNYAYAALATAGSIAALAAGAAAIALAGQFESGGIIPQVAGVATTGDQHIARVNPGELILNLAQQKNLADYIQALEDARGVEMAGSVVQVNMSGAYIYGLDEPAVGRAIYRNIRTLQSEGILK